MQLITIEELKRQIHYNRETGNFTWLTDSKKGGFKAGRITKSKDVYGYSQISINKKVYKAHRLAWFYVTGEWPKNQIDHINHIRDDNRFSNLIECDNQKNHLNRPMQRNNTTGIVGVNFNKNSWVASITFEGVRYHLGRFKDRDDAIAARKNAEKKLGFSILHGIGYGVQKPHKIKELKALEFG